MSKFISAFILILVFASCVQDESNGGNSPVNGATDLENKIKQLELDNSLKDSVINESLAFFNEIK